MVGKRVRVHFSAAALVNALVQKHGMAIWSGRGICLDRYGLFPGASSFSWGRIFHSAISCARLTKIPDCDAAPGFLRSCGRSQGVNIPVKAENSASRCASDATRTGSFSLLD